MKAKKIEYTKLSHGHSESDCHTCNKEDVCGYAKSLANLVLFYPWTIKFECPYYKKETHDE